MNNFTKTILAFSLITTAQTYSMFRVTRPVAQNSQLLMRRALLKRLMSIAKDSKKEKLKVLKELKETVCVLWDHPYVKIPSCYFIIYSLACVGCMDR